MHALMTCSFQSVCSSALCLLADIQYSLPWNVSLLAAIAISCIVLSVGSFPLCKVFCVICGRSGFCEKKMSSMLQ